MVRAKVKMGIIERSLLIVISSNLALYIISRLFFFDQMQQSNQSGTMSELRNALRRSLGGFVRREYNSRSSGRSRAKMCRCTAFCRSQKVLCRCLPPGLLLRQRHRRVQGDQSVTVRTLRGALSTSVGRCLPTSHCTICSRRARGTVQTKRHGGGLREML